MTFATYWSSLYRRFAGLNSLNKCSDAMTTKISDDQLDKVFALIRAGMPLFKAADAIGCHRNSLARRLKESGFKIHRGGRPSARRLKLPEDEIVAEYKAAPSILPIARRHGVSRLAISNLLKRHGIKLPRQINEQMKAALKQPSST